MMSFRGRDRQALWYAFQEERTGPTGAADIVSMLREWLLEPALLPVPPHIERTPEIENPPAVI